MLISDSQYLSWQKKLAENKFFRGFWIFCGIYSVLIYGFIGAYFLTWPQGWKIIALAFAAALVNRYIICEIINYFYKKQHPYQNLKFDIPSSFLFSFKDQKPDSWPSQHASTAMAISLVLYCFSLPLGIAAILTALVLGVGRIILGYHFVFDVIAGWIIGAITGLVVVYFLLPVILK